MKSKVWAVINWSVLVVITLIAVWMAWSFFSEEEVRDFDMPVPEKVCTDIVGLEELSGEACYDAYSKTIFLRIDRGKENYDIKELKASFVDLAPQSYTLSEVPRIGAAGAYKLPAKKNPGSVGVQLIVKDFTGVICEGERVIVDYCPTGIGGGGSVNVSISSIGGIEIKDFVDIGGLQDIDSDIVFVDVVDEEMIWEPTCKSSWDCGEWGVCENGVQRRTCRDSNNCAVSTDSPEATKRCDGACVEKWVCEWGDCKDGYSTPDCKDSNNCGTLYNIPKKLSCGRERCEPNVVCSEWSECDVDYNFADLVKSGSFELDGVRQRVCVDKKGCVASVEEEEVCSLSVDVYTKRLEKCGGEYVGVYDGLTDDMLAVLREGTGEVSSLSIHFGDEEDGVYCSYCFDGVMNGDEEDVDCGGSCRECVAREVYEERHWWDFLLG